MSMEVESDPYDGRLWPARRAHLSLPAIIAAARAGAIDHAWSMFRAGGYDQRLHDPAALATKGRLLRESALRASDAARARGFAAAAEAYAAADLIAPQAYSRANVAVLWLLSGDVARGCAAAKNLLSWLEREPDLPETPYYLAAARAEALLVCGDEEESQGALAEAIGRQPQAWEDHAATLNQLRLIAAAQQLDVPWLDRFEPPRSLHFAGHLGVAGDAADPLRAAIDHVLDEERIGFAFGALAAGSEIVLAEQALRAGAELHVILPTDVEEFAVQSVLPYGADWADRFRHCLAAATSVRVATRVSGEYEPLSTQLAADIAMGSAVLNAARLASQPVQALVIDEGPGPFGDGFITGRMGRRWRASGRKQHLIRAPRTSSTIASGRQTKPGGRPDRRLAAMLHISFDGLDALDDGAFAEALDAVVAPFRDRIAAFPVQPGLTLPAGNARIVAFPDPAAAWAYGRLLLADPLPRHPLRIGGHFGLVHWLDSPPALVGPAVAELGAIAAAAMPGGLTVSEAMASSLFVSAAAGLRAEPVGDVAGLHLFAMMQD